MSLIDNIGDQLISCCFDAVKDNVKENIDKEKMRQKLSQYADSMFEREVINTDIRFDMQGFLEYIHADAVRDIQDYLREVNIKESDRKKELIVTTAINYSHSRGHIESEALVRKLILAMLDIAKQSYTTEVPSGEIVVAKTISEQSTELIITNLNKMTEQIMETIESHKKHDKSSAAEELKKFIDVRKKWVKNQAIFPWFYDSLKYREVFPELFVFPELKTRNGECSFSELLLNKHNSIAILGDAGIGKSTLLKYLFAFDSLGNTNCLYLNASELKNTSNPLLLNLFTQEQSFEELIVFIDGIDEAYFDDPGAYKILIESIKNAGHCVFWIACRWDFFRRTLNESTTFAYEHYYIKAWNIEQSEYFIDHYSKIAACPDLPERIGHIVAKSEDLVKFKQNPFQLALLVFLAENDINNMIKGLYSLYDNFIRIWIKREIDRGTCKDDAQTISCELETVSKLIYSGGRYKIGGVANNNTAIKNLLIIDYQYVTEDYYSSAFYHRSIAAFLLAKNALTAMIKNQTENIIDIFTSKLKDDVTNFINDAFVLLTPEEKYLINNNLLSFYYKIKHQDEFFIIKEQVIYYLTRLGLDVSDFLLKEINPRPTNLTMRLTLAYGCVLSDVAEVKQFALEYAQSIANNSEDAVTNRAWTVIYFGDKAGNPYEYKDNEQCAWTNAREARIRRFTKKNPRPKDYRFRLFDIPLFHSFLNDRNWNDLSQEEYEILKNIEFPSEHFNEQERQFLEEQLSRLLKDYKKRLDESK